VSNLNVGICILLCCGYPQYVSKSLLLIHVTSLLNAVAICKNPVDEPITLSKAFYNTD